MSSSLQINPNSLRET
jgi:hypothetical protein